MMGMSIWFVFLVPLFIMMLLIGNWRRKDEEDEEVGSGTYQGEVGEEQENDSGDGARKKTKDNQTPLWKYVTKLGGGRGDGTTKFTCPHCRITYKSSYTCVKKNLCGVMP